MKTGDRKTDRKKRQTGRIQWMKIYLAPLKGLQDIYTEQH